MRRRHFSGRKGALAVLVGAALVATPLATAPVLANTAGTGVVINEINSYGGSGGAVYTRFVELFNPTDAAVPLSGLSLQYRSATGTANPTATYPLTGTIAANGYYLIQGSGAGSATLPTPDLVTGLTAAGASGTLFLANQTTPLTAPATGSHLDDPAVIDLVGWGSSNTFETATATGASTTLSYNRTAASDTDSNLADLTPKAPTPTNSGGGEPPVDPPTDPVIATIEQVQGPTDTSPLAGELVTTTGVVTASYPTGGFNGYYIQSAGTGANIDPATHTTSSGLFVYSPATVSTFPGIGDTVQVTGKVSEFQGTTELTVASATDMTVLPDAAAIVPAAIEVPLTAVGRESFEGMLLAPSGDFTVTDNYDTNYYASIVLNPGAEPLKTPTTVVEPGQPAIDYLAANLARAITLDDGSSINFNSAANRNIPLPYLSTSEPARIGSAVSFTQPVVLEYRFNAWNFQPTQQLTAAGDPPVTFSNTRTAAPEDVGGDVTLASFNVLNYFTTTGDELPGCEFYTDKDGNPITVSDGCDARGAASQASLERQQAKIVSAINALGADVVSLEEIENSIKFGLDRDAALGELVDALNAATGADTWEFVPSPAILPANQDVIRTAFIYKKAVVVPVGISVIDDDPAFASAARQPLAQQFALNREQADASHFVVIVNHFKSKGSGSGANADQGDGQGASNADRVAQASALVDFADSISASTGVDRLFLSGDFNSYLKEDPIDVILGAGYTDLGATTGKSTYAFDGAVGSLDHIFASPAASADVVGVDEWNINSVESIAFEYSRYNYNATNFYEPTPYRSSDHDPILVGIELADDLKTLKATPKPYILGLPRVGSTLLVYPGLWRPVPVKLTYQWSRNGVPIAGATKLTYKLTAADRGTQISVAVTGSKAGYATETETRSIANIR